MKKYTRLACFFIVCLLLAACSFSESSKSSAKSSGSLSDSVASSSRSSESKQQGYSREVADYTAEFVKSTNGEIAGFRAKLGKMATSYGITNWEEDKTTFVAIGKGLRKANLGKPQFEAFKTSLSGGVQWRLDAIDEGFR